MLATLKQRDFGLLWLGGLVSYTGNWATIAAIPFFVFEQTGSAFASGAVLTAMSLPLLFSSVAGTFVDRWERKRTLAIANVVMAAAVLPMLLASSGNFIWVVHAAVLAVASVNLFAYSAENALLPRLVGRDRLMAANSPFSSAPSLLGRWRTWSASCHCSTRPRCCTVAPGCSPCSYSPQEKTARRSIDAPRSQASDALPEAGRLRLEPHATQAATQNGNQEFAAMIGPAMRPRHNGEV